MTLKRTLGAIFKEVLAEADANPAFRERLERVLESARPWPKSVRQARVERRDGDLPPKRPSNRRSPAVLDPVHLARQGEVLLRSELAKLSLDQLRDVVAEYGLDPGKLVMKWRDPERIVDRIAEVASSRAKKGSAFRDHPSGSIDGGRLEERTQPEGGQTPSRGT